MLIEMPVDLAIGIEIGDLTWLNTDDARPASSQTDKGSEPLNQAEFARNFLGVSNSQKRANTDPAGTNIVIQVDGNYHFPCVSNTWEVGDLIGADEDSSGTALEDQQVKKVSDPDLAIGQCVRREATATTKVWARIISTKARDLAHGFFGMGARQLVSEREATMTGNETLTVESAMVQSLDPGGAGRDLTLPAVGQCKGKQFIVNNRADNPEIITIKNAGGTTICTPTQNEIAVVWCSGTAWYGLVGANI